MIHFGIIRENWGEWGVSLEGRRGDGCCRHGADEGRVTLTAVVVSTGVVDGTVIVVISHLLYF
jgi:hypothetical protein